MFTRRIPGGGLGKPLRAAWNITGQMAVLSADSFQNGGQRTICPKPLLLQANDSQSGTSARATDAGSPAHRYWIGSLKSLATIAKRRARTFISASIAAS